MTNEIYIISLPAKDRDRLARLPLLMSQNPFTRPVCGQTGYMINWFQNWSPDYKKKLYLLITKLGWVVRKEIQNAFK